MIAETILFILFSPGLLLPVIGKRVRIALVASYAFLFAVAIAYKDRIPLLNQLDETKEDFENKTLVKTGDIIWKILKWIFIILIILAIIGGIIGVFSGNSSSGPFGYLIVAGAIDAVSGLFQLLGALLGGG